MRPLLLASLAGLMLVPCWPLPSQPPLFVPEGPVAPHGLEEIHQPLHVVNRLYQAALSRGENQVGGGDFGVRDHFLRALEDKWHLVPSLNSVDRLEVRRGVG
jgi:hypothetical protein